MPIGIQRLNAPKPQPSSQIVFIKPLPGPDSAYAQDFLERIAAICHPIMQANHLSIMTLEEHEPNPEFIGRNFNAGEIIQLVLKAPYSGHWLSFRSVQMVMMHELAHCQQMNHGRDFWKVNNQFKGELRELWSRNYTGDGLWGRGQTLLSGQYDTSRNMENERMPQNLCGGTFRSRRRKRRRGNTNAGIEKEETYAEAKHRRITKKFGVNGKTLGGDKTTRVKLEYGQKVKGNPRVANSSRGRELRVAAAAARFGQQKLEEDKKEQSKEEDDQNGDVDSENDFYEVSDDGESATNLDGTQILDQSGQSMVKVCSDEDVDDAHVKQEMDELQELNDLSSALAAHNSRPEDKSTSDSGSGKRVKVLSTMTDTSSVSREPTLSSNTTSSSTSTPKAMAQTLNVNSSNNPDLICPICSMCNEPSSLLCIACSHVLDIGRVREHWRCQSETCKDSQYINAADCGFCGICAARRPAYLGGV